VAENTSFHTFREIPESFQVTITALNYRPYVFRSGPSTFIPDETHTRASVYPNPARQFVTIDIMEPAALVKICDLSGRVLEKREMNRGSHHVDLRAYPDGIYVVDVTTPSGKQSIRLIKQGDF
jgi:hypothetical protein